MVSILSRDWRVTVRDRTGARVAIADEMSCHATIKHLDIGTWNMELPLSHTAAPYLAQPGAGIIVEASDKTVMSGIVTRRRVEMSGADQRLIVAGVDDLVPLAWRLASPEPATPTQPYNTQAYDVRTGPAEDVIKAYVDANAGPGALAARRWPSLTVVASSSLGSTVTGRARWSNLLVHCVELGLVSVPQLGLRCTNLAFDVYATVDRSTVVEFSADRGSIGSIVWEDAAPAATWSAAAGGGVGTARIIVEGSAPSLEGDGWPRREVFTDRRDTTNTTELAAAAALALFGGASGVAQSGVQLVPIDTAGCQWIVDYQLGDLVGYVDPFGRRSSVLVREISIDIGSTVVAITPTLGTIDLTATDLTARFGAVARRTARLETI